MTQEQPIYVLELEETLAGDDKGESLQKLTQDLDSEIALVSGDIRKGLSSSQFARLDSLLKGLETAKVVMRAYWQAHHGRVA